MLQWMDDFQSYGTNTAHLSDGPYAEHGFCTLGADPDPTAGGKDVITVPSNSAAILRKVLTAPQTTIGVAARFWIPSLPSGTGEQPIICEIRDAGSLPHVYTKIDPSGYLQVYRVDTAGSVLIGQTSSPVVITNAWRHMEFKHFLDAVNGSVEIRLEGVTVLTVSGVRTTSNVSGSVATGQNVAMRHPHISGGATCDVSVKDFIIWDGTGTVNNDFMGSCEVYRIEPDSDVSLGWTPSTGTTGFNLINESNPDDDTNYVTAPFPLPSPSTFTLTDLPTNVTSVRGVMTVHRSRKTDGGDGQIQVSLISGANTGNGADRTITTAYVYWWDIFDQDPSGSNWSKVLVNALELKLNRTV